jgi:hypothetical protein
MSATALPWRIEFFGAYTALALPSRSSRLSREITCSK